MRLLLLAFFCIISFSASAQWWNVTKHKRYPQLVTAGLRPIQVKPVGFSKTVVSPLVLNQTEFSLSVIEHFTMKTAQHNMRFREYEEASYNFRDLAKVYVQLNKYSEAKWFFLQSNNLSRQQNNDRLTIANLMELAMVKTAIGDVALAKQDLDEAYLMATSRGWQDDAAAVNRRLDVLKRTKLAVASTTESYAGAVQSAL